MAGLRVLIHSLAFLILAQLLAFLATSTQNPGLQLVVQFMRWGSYIPFAIAASSALHQHKAVVLALLGITIIVGAPTSVGGLATIISPIGMGIIIGTVTKQLLAPEQTKAQVTTELPPVVMHRPEPRELATQRQLPPSMNAPGPGGPR